VSLETRDVRGSSNEAWPFPAAPATILNGLRLDVRGLRPLRWKPGQGTPLYYLDAAEGSFVLKLATPRRKGFLRLRSFLERQEIGHQAKVYRALAKQSYRHLRFPRLVATDDRRYLVHEYLETQPHGEHDLPRGQLLLSLMEFQMAGVDVSSPLAMTAARAPGVLLLRRLLSGLRARLGWAVVPRALQAMLSCYRAQPKLARPILRHNDFHYNNLLLTTSGVLFLSDFEYVSLDDRWLLGDIVHYAVGTKSYVIDTEVVFEYARLVEREFGFELDLAAQIRFSLMMRVGQLILSGAPPAVASEYARFFCSTLLNDSEFDRWLLTRSQALRPDTDANRLEKV
jgi:hypothetical protein